MGPGRLIALEGLDGAGKTTQARRLAAALRRRGFKVLLTREPSSGPYGRKLRRYLKSRERSLSPTEELELFLADRRWHVAQVIKPALAAGAVVITDRYYYSTAAYQGALGLDPREILAVNEAFAPKPDLVFLMTLPPAAALARRQKKGTPTQVTEAAGYLKKVAAIYRGLKGPHLYRLKAGRPPREIHARVLKKTLAALGET